MVFNTCKTSLDETVCRWKMLEMWIFRGNIFHVQWECKVLRSFWLKLCGEIEKIMKVWVPFHPRVFLLHNFRGLKGQRRDIFLAHMLMAASLLIAAYWNSVKIPSLQEWRQKIYYIFNCYVDNHVKSTYGYCKSKCRFFKNNGMCFKIIVKGWS